MAYRVAMLTGTGVIVTIGAAFSWAGGVPVRRAAARAAGRLPLFFPPRVRDGAASVRRHVPPHRPLARPAEHRPGWPRWSPGSISSSTPALYRGWADGVPVLKEVNFPRAVGLGLLLALALMAAFRNQLAARADPRPRVVLRQGVPHLHGPGKDRPGAGLHHPGAQRRVHGQLHGLGRSSSTWASRTTTAGSRAASACPPPSPAP